MIAKIKERRRLINAGLWGKEGAGSGTGEAVTNSAVGARASGGGTSR